MRSDIRLCHDRSLRPHQEVSRPAPMAKKIIIIIIYRTWTEAEIDQFYAASSEGIARGVWRSTFYFMTGQRRQDIRPNGGASIFAATSLSVKQSKSGSEVSIPCQRALQRALLDDLPRDRALFS